MNKISVVIPTYQDNLEKCLLALDGQSIGKEQYEVIVVENGCRSNEVKRSVRKYPFAKYLFEPRKGAYFARNLGWKNASYHIVAFTDADCIPDKDWLKHIQLFFSKKNNMAMGGTITKIEPHNWVETYAQHLAGGQKKLRFKSYLPGYPYVVAANMAFRKSILINVHGFDEAYTSGGDGDLCWKIKDFGYATQLVPSAVVEHPCRGTIKSYFKQHYHYGKGHPMQFKKWYKKTPQLYIDTKNLALLFKNLMIALIFMVPSIFSTRQRERFLKSILEVVRILALVLGRLVGSVRYKVLYI